MKLPESEVLPWFSKTHSKEISKAKADAIKLIREIGSDLSGIISSLEDMSRARFSGEERVHSAANMVKELVVKRGQSPLNSVISSLPEADYSSMSRFSEEAGRMLEDISGLTPKQTYLLNTYFPRQARSFADSIKAASSRIEEMKDFLGNRARIMAAEKELASLLDKRSELSESMKSLEKRKKQFLERIESLKRNEESLEREMNGLLKSDEYLQVTELEKKSKVLGLEMENLRKDILNHLLPLEKPLKKFEYYAGKGHPLSPEQEKLLEKLIINPFEAVLRSDELAVQELIFLMEKAIDEGKISVKSGEKHRIKVAYESLDSDIPDSKKKYLSLEMEARAVKYRIKKHSGTHDKMEAIKSLMENNRQKMDSLHISVKKLLKEREALQGQMEENTRKIESIILESTNKRVVLA